MTAKLWELSEAADPTPFHQLLGLLDKREKLHRVYTQNIDSIEEKAGLTYGIPNDCPPTAVFPDTVPRCVPLHGTLKRVRCQTCQSVFPLRNHLTTLTNGARPPCPECAAQEERRREAGKRPHGIGWLRPTIVLYNEHHVYGEMIANLVERDCKEWSGQTSSSRVDFLLVAGTSLKIPGIKSLIRELAGAVRLGQHMSAISNTKESSQREHRVVRTAYLNFDFCGSARDWEGIFDVWISGDVQTVAQQILRRLLGTDRFAGGTVETAIQ